MPTICIAIVQFIPYRLYSTIYLLTIIYILFKYGMYMGLMIKIKIKIMIIIIIIIIIII